MMALDPVPLFPQWPDTLDCLYKQPEPSDTLSWQLQFSSYIPIGKRDYFKSPHPPREEW